jgi:hypothetical protein
MGLLSRGVHGARRGLYTTLRGWSEWRKCGGESGANVVLERVVQMLC